MSTAGRKFSTSSGVARRLAAGTSALATPAIPRWRAACGRDISVEPESPGYGRGHRCLWVTVALARQPASGGTVVAARSSLRCFVARPNSALEGLGFAAYLAPDSDDTIDL
jgi:hypothetical protein